MTREERIEEIAEICATHNCTEKRRKIHFDQYVDRAWHPHPSDKFIIWFQSQDDFLREKVNPKVAWNCQSYRDQWTEAVASVAPD